MNKWLKKYVKHWLYNYKNDKNLTDSVFLYFSQKKGLLIHCPNFLCLKVNGKLQPSLQQACSDIIFLYILFKYLCESFEYVDALYKDNLSFLRWHKFSGANQIIAQKWNVNFYISKLFFETHFMRLVVMNDSQWI